MKVFLAPRHHHETIRGFTLIEVLCVIALIGLAASIVMPSLRHPPGWLQLETSARRIVALMRLAQAHATGLNETIFIRVDVDARQIVVEGQEPLELPSRSQIKAVVARPERMGTSGVGFTFFPDGTSTGGEIILTLGSSKAKIAVNWLTGATKAGLSRQSDPQ